MYLQTSDDILNWAIAISVLGIAFLLGWLLIYAIIIIRRAVKITGLLEQGLIKLDNLISSAKDKLENSASYLSILAWGIKDLVAYLLNKKAEGSSKRRAKK